MRFQLDDDEPNHDDHFQVLGYLGRTWYVGMAGFPWEFLDCIHSLKANKTVLKSDRKSVPKAKGLVFKPSVSGTNWVLVLGKVFGKFFK